ncbi:MAG: TOTE conflict system archaeo-eukaryotic primase domain-containing protein [Oscillospiraceae bacterium]
MALKTIRIIFINNNEDTSCASEIAKRILDSFNVQERFPDVIVDDGKYDSILSMVNWINSKSSHIAANKITQMAKVTKLSSPQNKINLFRSLFKGREDVYALRWYNVKTEKSGYSPVCSNKWLPGVCNMTKVKCADCNYRSYTPLDDKAIYH